MVAAALENLIHSLETVPFEDIPTALTPDHVPPILRDTAFLAALREVFATLAGQLQDLRHASEAELWALTEALAYLLDTPAFGRWLRARLVRGRGKTIGNPFFLLSPQLYPLPQIRVTYFQTLNTLSVVHINVVC